MSLDDRRSPLLPEDKLGAVPVTSLTADEHAKNNLPDVLTRWLTRGSEETSRARTDQSLCVPKRDIIAQGYDLSLNRYKEVIHAEVDHKPPLEILVELAALETEIQEEIKQLEALLR